MRLFLPSIKNGTSRMIHLNSVVKEINKSIAFYLENPNRHFIKDDEDMEYIQVFVSLQLTQEIIDIIIKGYMEAGWSKVIEIKHFSQLSRFSVTTSSVTTGFKLYRKIS